MFRLTYTNNVPLKLRLLGFHKAYKVQSGEDDFEVWEKVNSSYTIDHARRRVYPTATN